jgi:hypothetical protein
MRGRASSIAMTAVALVVSAAPAAAQDGWRWLEKLSGPGDFYGYELGAKLLCKYDDARTGRQGEVESAISLPCLMKRQAAREVDLARRIYAFGVSAGYLRALSNDLQYAPSDEHIDRTVHVIAVEGFYDHRIGDLSRLDYGVAVGANWFVGRAFDNFVRTSVEPRVSFKLFDLRRGTGTTAYKGTFTVRVGALIWFKEFTAEDFGAIPGTYRSGTEIGPSVRFIFDFDRNPFK